MSRKFKLTRAKFPKSLIHAPNLFCCHPKGERHKRALNVHYPVKDKFGSTFDFHGPEQLGTTDLRVLQGIVAFAVHNVDADGRDAVGAMMKSCKHKLKITGHTPDKASRNSAAVRFKLSDFAHELGYARPSAATLARLRASIARLGAVRITANRPGFQSSCQMLSGYVQDTSTGEVIVALNPELTRAALAKKRFQQVDFKEVRALQSDAARLLHSRLHWINAGESHDIGLGKLVEYVYGDTPASPTALSNRRKTVRSALRELEGLRWQVRVHPGGGKYTIRRPASKAEQIKMEAS